MFLTKQQNEGFNTAGALFTKMNREITKALPRHLSGEAFARNALTSVRQNATLLEALTFENGRTSFLGALMQAAQLGLQLGPLGHCYLVPYAKWKDNKIVGYEVTFILGYKGMVELSRRSGNMRSVYANEVRENDHFELGYGSGGQLVHRPALREDRGDWYGVYAFAELVDGGYQYVFLSREEIDRIRDKYSKATNDRSPWRTEPIEMAKKTAIRRLFKVLPISVEVSQAMEVEDKPLRYDQVSGTIDIEATVVEELPELKAPDPDPEEPPPTPAPVERQPVASPATQVPEPTVNGYRIFDVPQKISGSHARRAIGAMVRSMSVFSEDDNTKVRTVLQFMCKSDVESFLEEMKSASAATGEDGQLSEREDVVDSFLARYFPLLPPTATTTTLEEE